MRSTLRLIDLRNQLLELRRRLSAAKDPFYDEFGLSQNVAWNQNWTDLLQRVDALHTSLRSARSEAGRFAAQEKLVALDEYVRDLLSYARGCYPVDRQLVDDDVEHQSVVEEHEFAAIPSEDEQGDTSGYRITASSAVSFIGMLAEFDGLLQSIADRLIK